MKVALVRPPNQGSLVRGIGFYADRLFNALSKIPNLELSWMNYSKNPFAYQKYDIAHFPYFDLFYLTFPPVRVSRTIVTLHDVIPLKFPTHFPKGKKAKIAWPIQKKLLSGVNAVITDSEVSKRDILEESNLNASKVFVTHLAADPEFHKMAKVKNKFHLPERFALYVGGVNWNKNVPSLIKACQEIKIPLVLVGQEFTGANSNLSNVELLPFKEILKLLKDDPNIIRLGFVETPDLAEVYNLASVYVCPSTYEGFGLPLLEALASGTPAISGGGGSLKEIAGDAPVYANVENPHDLAGKIKEVLAMDKARLAKLSEKGMAQAAKFSWAKTAAKTFEVYDQVLGN